MKKRILGALAVVMLFISSLTMVACGDKKVQAKDVYKQTNEFLEYVDAGNAKNNMFETAVVSNVNSKFVIAYFNKGSKKLNYINQTFINPMNFVVTYKEDLQRLNEIKILSSKNEIVNKYSSNLEAFKSSYLETTVQYDRLQSFSQTSGVIIEGAEQLFINELTNFIDVAYKTANSLAEIKDEVLNDYSALSKTVKKVTTLQIASVKDYVALKLGTDINRTLLNELKINKVNTSSSDPSISGFVTEFVNPLYKSLDKLSLLQSKADFKEIGTAITKEVDGVMKIVGYTNSEVANLLITLEILDNEKDYFNSSLDKFNLYGFYQDYGCSMEACVKSVENAPSYYSQIKKYTADITPAFVDYFISVFVA